MRRRFHDRFIRPISTDSDQAEREIVFNYLLVGVFGLAVIALLDTVLAPIISHEAPHLDRIINNLVIIGIIAGIYALARYKGLFNVSAIVLTSLITAMSCLLALGWGLLLPTGLLMFSLSVVMAGVLIGARFALYVTGLLIVVMACLQYGQTTGRLHPNLNWVGTGPTAGDVIGFSAILLTIALVSWLFNRQMELSLARARRSERALQRQRDLLEVKVQRRTQQLDAARLEQMRELYRFAELGRLSTALFHDLANHLATVNIDIEGLKSKDAPDIMRRIRDNVRHIDDVVRRVRHQIQGKSSIETFNVMNEINEVMDILSFDADRAGVRIMLEPGSVRPSLCYKGDITRFRQILLNIISNGIEAYPTRGRSRKERSVTIGLERKGTELTISVTDHGQAIARADQKKIFEPFYTTKSKGVGIGLFIVRQVVDNDFEGSLSVRSDKRQGTVFSVRLPKSYYAKSPQD